MNNFLRVVRLALAYRWRFAASVVCALLVAVFWGGNITAVYPIVQVAFEGQSLQEWIQGEIDGSTATLRELEREQAQLDAILAEGSSDAQNAARRRSEQIADRLRAERWRLEWSSWLQPAIDRWLPHDPFLTLASVVALLLLGTLAKSVFYIAHSVLSYDLSQRAVFDLRKQFFRRTLRMDLATFGADGTADLMSRFTYDTESVAAGLRALFGKAVREPLKMIACLVGAALVCWRLLLLSLVVAPVAAWCISRLAKSLKRANRRAMEEMSQTYNILEEAFQGIKVVKAFTMERYERRRFHGNNKKFYEKNMRIARYDALTHPLTEVMGIVTIALALLAGAYLVLNQETHLLGIRMSERPLSLPTLLLFYGLLAGVSDPARKLSEVFNQLQRASAACDRIYALVDREPTIVDPPKALPLARHRREIEFRGIDFAYQPGLPVLSDVNLRIAFGETIAIVGPNGCGKTTLASMIPRFFDPLSGEVTIDGVDVRQVRLRSLRSQIGLVTQETLLFDDTVANNIRYGSPHASAAEVREAAERAHAHRFILERLDNGYDSVVGPRGSLLSGGQRQRIALARAILRDPAILILDEATSQIDLESEQLIHRVLEQFIRNRTTVIVTHRLATLALADRIVVMDTGRILDVGPHEELMRRCAFYGRLYDMELKESA